MNGPILFAECEKMIGRELGLSEWIMIDQPRIDDFAKVTDDHQFIHTNPVAAKASPFGGTVAHGFLTLSLLSRMALDLGFGLKNTSMVVNYGFEKIRFIDAVRSGSKVRGRFILSDATERAPGQIMVRLTATVEVEGEIKPALVADWLTLQFLNSDEPQSGTA